MSKPILVTAATGRIGGAVVAELLSRGEPVRALVRSLDRPGTRARLQGAELVVGDMFNYDDLRSAMEGVERAFYCPPMDPYALQTAVAFSAAAADARLRSVVVLSQWLSSARSPALLTRQHWLIDKLFARMTDIMLTIVNPGFFADNMLSTLLPTAAQLGQYPWPYGDSLNAFPSNQDIARVIVAALSNPERHDGCVYRPTGPELLSGKDIAATLTRVLGKPVKLVAMPEWVFMKAVRAAGFPPFAQLLMRTYNEEQRRGAFAYNAPTDHVLQATGTEPESFETTVRRYADAPAAQRSFSNRMKAVGELIKIIVTPSLDLARFSRDAAMPAPATSRLSIDDERWLREHHPGFDSSFIDRRQLAHDGVRAVRG